MKSPLIFKKDGFVLLIAIGLLGLLAVIVIGFSQISRQHVRLSQRGLDLTRVSLLARSGLELALADVKDFSSLLDYSQPFPVGTGTYREGGDQAVISSHELNGQININDGIQAGGLELGASYQANVSYPWLKIPNGPDFVDSSGLMNLRLRNLLNAYGEVHRYLDHLYEGDPQNCSNIDFYGIPYTQIPQYSTKNSTGIGFHTPNTPDIDPSDASYNNGLGDRIIESRPGAGYQSIDEIESIVNKWASDPGIELSEDYLKSQSFFDLIRNDLTVISYEDTEFFRMERHFRDDWDDDLYPKNTFINSASNDFEPQSLSEYGDKGPVKEFPKWHPHSVALINLNSSSFHVRSAVFNALIGVVYPCENNLLIPPYRIDHTSNFGNDYFDSTTARQAAIAAPYVGIMYPILNDYGFTNGVPLSNTSSLMSIRDAMHLSYQYEVYKELEGKQIFNFDDFRDFLMWHENNSDPHSAQQFPSYERALPLQDPVTLVKDPVTLDGTDFNAGGLFHVSEPLSAAFTQDGVFKEDYVSKTLPHILSCVRRLPSYLGAPSALQSPYLILKNPPAPFLPSKENKPRNLPFCKIEDFVWRFHLPKICFLSCGYYEVSSQAKIHDPHNETIASAPLRGTFKVFETKYYRTQKSFLSIRDPQTHSDIKIGPNPTGDVSQADPFIGVVGLKDFEEDTVLDPLSKFDPQIIMNFDFEETGGGVNNPSTAAFNPQPQNPADDDWITALEDYSSLNAASGFPIDPEPLRTSQMEGQGIPFFNYKPGVTVDTTDLSPFNGALFLGTNRNANYVAIKDEKKDYRFNDSLYWRLDDWLDETKGGVGPVGTNLSAFTTSFWFRLPSNYGYTYPLSHGIPFGVHPATIHMESYSYTLLSLNLWESFSADLATNPTMVRPVSIHLGLKKTKKNGLVVFNRYDSGGPSHKVPSAGGEVYDAYPYIAPAEYQDLKASEQLSVAAPQYDYLGFLCLSAPVPEEDNYDSYRGAAYRSSEVFVPFSNVYESAPGSWHRASGGVRLGWEGPGLLTTKKQLWVHLHTDPNEMEDPHEDYEAPLATYPPGDSSEIQNPLQHLRLGAWFVNHYPGGDIETGGGLGFMLPFNPTMVLSLGESHGLSLSKFDMSYSVFGGLIKGDSPYFIDRGDIVPLWRFGSTIDNFRFKITSSSNPDFQDYLDPESEFYSGLLYEENPFRAMRYNVTSYENQPEFAAFGLEYAEPDWIMDFGLPSGTKILSVGTRVYYPPDTHHNYPYVRLSLFDDDGEIEPSQTMPKNEQDLFYGSYIVGDPESFKAKLQYMSYRPKHNGNQNDTGEKLEYLGPDFVTNIPWAKEIATRHVLPNSFEEISVN